MGDNEIINFEEVDDEVKKTISKTRMFVVPDSWTRIGIGAFNNNTQLRKIIIGESVKELGENCFNTCSNLEEVILPEGLKKLPNSAFYACRALRVINVPKSVEIIENQAFDGCKNLNSIVLPDGLKNINMFAFCDTGLRHIDLPNSLTHLGECAFSDSMLEDITIPNNIDYLGEETFYHCVNLKKVVLGPQITSIGEKCFSHCFALNEINIPDSVLEISEGAFGACNALTHIKLPDGITTIEQAAFAKSGLNEFYAPKELTHLGFGAFGGCEGLKNFVFNEKLTYVPANCFMSCNGLTQMTIPANIKAIKEDAFLYCKNLKKITLEEGVETISERAFGGCQKLVEVVLPDSVKHVGDMAFGGCIKLEKVVIPKGCDFKDTLPFKPAYITLENNQFVITKHRRRDAYKCTEDLIGLTLLNFENKDNFYRQMEDPAIRNLYEAMFSILPKEDFEKFVENKNIKFYKRLYSVCHLEKVDKRQFASIYKFLYNLGAFENKRLIEVTTKSGIKQVEVFPAQKVCEYFIASNFDFSKLVQNDIKIMRADGYKHEFTEFLLAEYHLSAMLELDRTEKNNFFAKCFNEFEEIQRTNTSNKGSQRQLKPSVEKFVSYFKTNKFEGVTQESEKLALTLAPYFSKQITFDRAKRDLKEFETQGLAESLIELDKYKVIDECAAKIVSLAEDSINQIKEAAKVIDYEWLKKNDERIFILGKLCSCCAHAEGQGYGFVRASIVHPDVQTLVIKKGDLIIAKATIYVNPKKGYAVVNTVSFNSAYKKDADMVYKKFSEGIQHFAKSYNELHENKIKIITVGMGLNGIEKQIRKNAKQSEVIYKSLNYGEYGVSGARYAGDSKDEQYIIWEEQNERQK